VNGFRGLHRGLGQLDKRVVAGSTLIVSSQTGAFSTALFVSIAGGDLWTIFCYLVFKWRSVNRPSDGLYHQQQVLRNASSDSQALWDLLKAFWQWRRSARRPFLRSIGLILAALASSVGFIIAGIFSSYITCSLLANKRELSKYGTDNERISFATKAVVRSRQVYIELVVEALLVIYSTCVAS
jgi:hypothetical protein